ncbi:MAG: DNA mismatch repair endonuclease MutL, partial [Dialister sp.]|nr:DNA mismatch repair endonuclease MutL [Dialister sp.]
LFYNVPARKKFLKSERTEASRINTMMGKLALANPDISFRLINNGRTVIETPGNGRLLDVVSALYGTKTAGEMLEVSGENERGILSGLISKPSLLKSSRQYQTIIINRRVVESSAVSKAVDNAYHSLLPKNGYPILVLAFTVAPESIDVNVHPQKREIKFSDEQSIFRLVYHSVLQSLTTKDTPDEIAREMIKDPGHQVAKESDFDLTSVKVEEARSVGPDIGLTEKEKDPARWGEPGAVYAAEERRPMPAWHPQGKTARERREIPFTPSISKEKLFSKESVFPGVTHEEKEALTPEVLFDAPKAEEPIIPLGQVAKCFILCQRGMDLFIIDQHAAHERVRYDRLAARAEGIPVQDILVPYLLHADPEDLVLLEEHEEDLARLGITFEQAGPDVIRITGSPEDLSEADMDRVMKDITRAFHEKDVPSPETMRHRMMAYAACRGAIKRGDPLNIRQMKELIVDLFHTSRPFVCPHGRPTIVKFTPEELGRLFKRP